DNSIVSQAEDGIRDFHVTGVQTCALPIYMQESYFLLYTTPSGDVRLDVMLFEESIWLTQKAMAELFSVGVPAISKHLANIFESGELVEDAVISILETTASDGKNYKTKYYNL